MNVIFKFHTLAGMLITFHNGVVVISSVRRIFKRGARKFKKFENNEDQNENFPARNKVRFPAHN